MTASLDDALDEAAAAIDRIRNDLNFADSHFNRNPRDRDRDACLNASAFIWLASIVERFVKRILVSILEELNARGVRRDRVKYSLVSLAIASELDSCEQAGRLRKWRQRAAAFASAAEAVPVAFNLAVIPIDGRTIRVDHFETIWQTFGFSGDPMLHPRCQLALNDLAAGRNDLAHGKVDPVTFGRRKNIADTRRLVEIVEDILLHVHEASERYLTNNEYVR